MFEPGTQVGRYEIQRQLGRGGMGWVYAAHDPVLGRLVAIKVFAGDLAIPDARERFEREARAAAALTHAHIMAVYDFGEYASQPYIVMEYVPGETLADVIRRKAQLSIGDKLRWMEELTAAVGYAHQAKVIHRDIKPANLIIDRSRRLKILDFGIARMLGSASHTKEMIGTPGYMAPEQIIGAPVDGRADLFSIGVVFYELLSYAEAFPGDNLPAITHRILTADPVPLQHLVPSIHPEVSAIIEQALKKNVEERFRDAESLREAISRVRRRLAEDSDVTIVAPARRRDTPVPARGRPGTGSARRPMSGVVGVATPPPPDPETFARRRNTLIEAALTQARTLLASGELELALAACQQALTYDEQHLAALELDRQIRLAFVKRDTGAFGEETALVPADEIPEPAAPETESAPTVLAPSRRTPAPLPPAAPPLLPSSAPIAQPRLATNAPATAPARSSLSATCGAAIGAVSARLRTSTVGLITQLSVAGSSIKTASHRLFAMRLRIDRKAMIAGGVAVVIIVAIGVVIARRPVAGPPLAGTVVIDAVPWGTITAIEAENGERQPLPALASTPLVVSLPPGTYQVVVEGPAPDSEVQRISVDIESNVENAAPPIRFRVITPNEYFDPYLTVQSVPDEAGAAPLDAAPALPAVTPAPAAASPVPGSAGVSP